jgi:hypothetical protein
VGIQPRRFDLASVADGFRKKSDGGYEVVSLRLTDAPVESKKWWQIEK